MGEILCVIHDRNREDRRELLEKEQVRQGIDVVWFFDSVHDLRTAHQNIAEAHKRVVRFAKERKMDRVFIAEDDVHFPAEDGWRYFLKSVPSDFSVFLGGIYTGEFLYEQAGFRNRILKRWSGMHLYCVHHSYYDRFLSIDTDKHNIERALVNEGGLFKLCFPFAAVQAETVSDNIKGYTHKIKDYFDKYNCYGL